MKELIALPIVFSILFGLAFELVDIAESSSEKVIGFAESMENALDCAFAGVSIEICSPELSSINFDEEIARFNETNEKIRKIAEETLSQYNNYIEYFDSAEYIDYIEENISNLNETPRLNKTSLINKTNKTNEVNISDGELSNNASSN